MKLAHSRHLTLLIALSLPVMAQTRRALVIGNANYGSTDKEKLDSPHKDAWDIWKALVRLGFDAGRQPLLDANIDQLIAAIDAFVSSLQPNDTAAVYYSGHGAEIGGANYLIPIGFQASSESLVAKKAVDASNDLLRRIRARTNGATILILDACRDNPYVKFKSGGRKGLVPLNASGAYIAFATAPGEVASDGGRGNSLFTSVLLKYIERRDLDIHGVFTEVRAEVSRRSQSQYPYSSDGLQGRYYFHPQPLVAGRLSVEEEFWSECKGGNAEACQTLVRDYPNGQYAVLARARVKAPSQPTVNSGEPRPGEKRRNPKDGLLYAYIPAGPYEIGCLHESAECREDEPIRRGTFARGFWMGETEVPQSAYQNITGQNPSHIQGENRPVESVTWNQAKEYCKAVGGRLPSEAEWEYAARAGSREQRYGPLDRVAWYSGNSGSTTHDVKEAGTPNAWGLYDMLGNVWEWTASLYSRDKGWYVLRGGSWHDFSSSVRASIRYRYRSDSRGSLEGFRCVRDSL